MVLKKYNNKEQMSHEAAVYTKDLINQKSSLGKVFTIALSGGNSPVRYYELLAKEDIDWILVKVFIVDERKVSSDNLYSNYRMIKKSLLSGINIPENNIYSFNTGMSSVSKCALEYENRVRKVFGENPPVFDLIILGVGPDGHTASLFPGKDHSLEKNRIFISTIAPSPFDVPERLTMSLPLINSANNRIFVISGKGKDEMVQRVCNADSTIPAGMINSNSTIFYNFPLLASV